MDTVLAVVIVLAALAGIARSVWRRIARPSAGSCDSGCDGCALASRCGTASAAGASPRPAADPSSPSHTGIARP